MIEEIRQLLGAYRPQSLSLADAHPAAVLIPLYERDGRHHVILTKRSDLVEHHKGEISFPGGAFDPADPDLLTTALREAEEEIGLLTADVEVLGQLDDFLTISNFRVAPFVGRVVRSPYEWRINEHEVDRLLEVPIEHLVAPGSFAEEPRVWNGRQYNHITYSYDGHVVWGATAFMLKQFLDLTSRGR